ncbi:MAG: phage/plasmid primase, P4 family [Actinomycetota bacterium]|nr:phage/plasmid primase, P4 family [Actinomycetota bacterium]
MDVKANPEETLRAALDYRRRGLRVVPVKFRDKAPVLDGWQNSDLDEAEIRADFEGVPRNIGLILGEVSGDLVDVDLDSKEALALADTFLPGTGAVFGRVGKPRSHRLFVCPGAASIAFKDVDNAVLFEIRSNAQQTVAPPSVHPSGERVEWDGDASPEPVRVDAEELEERCRLLATAALVTRHLPPPKDTRTGEGGGRHGFALPLAGFLLRRLDGEVVSRILHTAWDAAGGATEEAHRDLDDIVRGTLEALEAGEEVSGGPSLEEMAPGVPKLISRWWGWEKKRKGRGSKDEEPTHDELRDRWLVTHPGVSYGLGGWMAYGKEAPGVWTPVPDHEVERQILAVCVAAKREGVRPTYGLLSSVAKFARIAVSVPDEAWDADPDILVCRNGALHVPSGELRNHEPGHYATSGVPYAYDSGAAAPTWERFLSELVDPETALFLQEFAGYCLTIDVSHEAALWLCGPPGGGRSTFIAGIEAMLGEKAGVLGLGEIERSQFALADVPGKTLLMATEQPAGFLKASYTLNALISGDRLRVEKKYKDAFHVHPRAKILWAMNDLPRVQSANDGLFRRVKVVEIEPVPEGRRDPKVKEAVKGEGSGILVWALEGLARLRERGRFEVPEAVKDATARWREQNDVAAMFVGEECETGTDKKAKASDLYRSYRRWCEQNGHKAKSVTQVAEDWRRLGFAQKRTKEGVSWHGVAVPENPFEI